MNEPRSQYDDVPLEAMEDTSVIEQPIENKETKVAEPVAPNVASVQPQTSTSVGTLVLQWLAYAFWGWFGIAMGWLAAVVFTYAVTRDASVDWANMLAYPLAAVIILFIFALATDFFYARREPAKKAGAANVIMVLHAVPFVLVSIGALITAVFCLISMILNNNSPYVGDSSLIALYTALATVVMFGLIAARVLFGSRRAAVRIVLWVMSILAVLVFLIVALSGPAMEAIRTRDDRLIEDALPSLASDIRDYTSEKNQLPVKLTDVTHGASDSSAQVQRMIDQNLVTYKPNTLPSTSGNSWAPSSRSSSMKSYDYTQESSDKKFYYQMCVDYKAEKKSRYNYKSSVEKSMSVDGSAGSASDYSEYFYNISAHPKGNVCYNLYATGEGKL